MSNVQPVGPWLQVGLENYPEWVGLVAEFTISSLNSWQWASGSVYYLLGLWCARLQTAFQ